MPQKLEPNYQPGMQYTVDGAILNAIIREIRANRPIAGQNIESKETANGIILDGNPAGAAPSTLVSLVAFQIVAIPGTPSKWRVQSAGSTVLDGTNGTPYDLSSAGFDSDNDFSSLQEIILEADISESGVASGWTLYATSTTGQKEVQMDASSPPKQTKARLVIGQVSIVDSVPVSVQYVTSSQILAEIFLNGRIVKGFH